MELLPGVRSSKGPMSGSLWGVGTVVLKVRKNLGYIGVTVNVCLGVKPLSTLWKRNL